MTTIAKNSEVRVTHLVPSHEHSGGGVTAAAGQLCAALQQFHGINVLLDAPKEGRMLLGSEVGQLERRVLDFGPNVVHVHGLWLAHARAGGRVSERHGLPEVVSPHGMLDPWALRNQAWKKRIVWHLFEKKHLERATVIHALCKAEGVAIRTVGIRNPIAVIPNGVALPSTEVTARPVWAEAFGDSAKVLLFLGRLHPKKGVDGLIKAWSALPEGITAAGWRLAIVGWDDGGHLPRYRRQVAELGIAQTCRLFGPAFGGIKAATLNKSAAFVLPSLSEGLPMAVLEAWANRLPVLMTRACNMPEGFTSNAAFEINAEPLELAAQIASVLGRDSGALREAGENGRRLVETQFTWDRVEQQFASLYRWLLGSGHRPNLLTTE